jgi:hypothetical protein
MSFAGVLHSTFLQVRTMGFKSGSGCGTVTAIVNRTRLANLRDLHRREVACERHWRIRRGMTPVSGVAHAANRPTAATPSTPQTQRTDGLITAAPGRRRSIVRRRRSAATRAVRCQLIAKGYGRAALIGRGTAQSRDDLFGEPLEGRTVFRYHDEGADPIQAPLGHVVSAFKSYGSKF